MRRLQESELGLISVILFISTSPERSEIPLANSGKGGNSIHNRSIIFDEERLDPHGVGNLPFFQWQLSSTYGVMQGIRVKCMHY